MRSILVVDDDKVLLRTVRAVLEKAGFSVTTALDGYVALEKIQLEKFNLIITDLNMPHQFNGFRLIKAIRDDDRNKKSPIMVLTGRNSSPDVIRSVEAGADEYVVKPIDFDILLSKVVTLIETKNTDQGFINCAVRSAGEWTASFEVVGISEQGITFVSSTPMPMNFKFKINSTLFNEVGITPPLLRILSSHEVTGTELQFQIEASFVGLVEADLQFIRLYIHLNRHKLKKTS